MRARTSLFAINSPLSDVPLLLIPAQRNRSIFGEVGLRGGLNSVIGCRQNFVQRCVPRHDFIKPRVAQIGDTF